MTDLPPPPKCELCTAEMVLADSGWVCPQLHGPIVPRRKGERYRELDVSHHGKRSMEGKRLSNWKQIAAEVGRGLERLDELEGK